MLRRRAAALTALLVTIFLVGLLVTEQLSPAARRPGAPGRPLTASGGGAKQHPARPRPASATPAGTYGIGTITLHLVDHSRTIPLPSGQLVPRPVTTIVRFPTRRGHGSRPGSPPPDLLFPLIVFGHGFNIMPHAYARLLAYWTSAGFVVAAPIFPRENPDAPGGPNETDLPNQPDDMRFVISNLLRLSARRSGPLHGLIDPHEVAVAGHSDGGDTALALAYDPTLRDPHLQAAVILSGAEIPMLPAFTIAPGGPPLLATQGTADTVNLPSATAAYFDTAAPPKYLLQLLGGTHMGPYATDRPELGVVERVTTAFLQHYLDHDGPALVAMLRAGHVAGVAQLTAG